MPAPGAAGDAGAGEPPGLLVDDGAAGVEAAGVEAAGAFGVDSAGRGAVGAAGAAEAGVAAAGAAGAGVAEAGAAGAAGAGRAGPGRAEDGVAVFAGAAGAAEEAGDAAGLLPVTPSASSLALSFRTTGGSMLEDGPLTNSPISLSFARAILVSIPRSAATSCTRGFAATFLLSEVRPDREDRLTVGGTHLESLISCP